MRGGGRWGFYGFPDCYNGKGERECTERMMDDNDRYAMLYNSISVNNTAMNVIYLKKYAFEDENK